MQVYLLGFIRVILRGHRGKILVETPRDGLILLGHPPGIDIFSTPILRHLFSDQWIYILKLNMLKAQSFMSQHNFFVIFFQTRIHFHSNFFYKTKKKSSIRMFYITWFNLNSILYNMKSYFPCSNLMTKIIGWNLTKQYNTYYICYWLSLKKCHAVQVHKVLAPPQAWNLNNLTYYCKQSVTDQISNIHVVTCSYWQ